MKKLLTVLSGCPLADGVSAEGRLNLYCAYPAAEAAGRWPTALARRMT